MAELSRFFADIGGDRLTTAAQMNRLFDQLLQEKDGVLRGLGNALAVTNAGTLSVDVNTGSAVMGGRLYENTASVNLPLDAVTSGSKRYDRIVVRVDETARTMVLTVIKGVEGASPSVPAIDGTTDVLLAKILIDRSSGSYVYTLTDERAYCNGLLLPAIIAKLNGGTFTEDDLAEGTTYKRIAAANANAINGGTFDAYSVSRLGLAGTEKSLAGTFEDISAIGIGFFGTTTNPADKPTSTESYWRCINLRESSTNITQIAITKTISPQRMYIRTKISGTWSSWYEIWNAASDGNGGQPPAAKENRTSNSTIGWFDVVDCASGAQVTLPSGGTFAYEVLTYGTTYNGTKAGIVAGGLMSGTASANLTMRYRRLS